MKYTLLVTRDCNLRCRYCYVGKQRAAMSLDTAGRCIDLAFARTPSDELIEIAFFGGEPLLEFDLVRAITDRIEHHPGWFPGRVQLSLVSNGTRFDQDLASFVREHHVALGISCDGPPAVQDRFRRFANGRATGARVERNLKRALEALGGVMVNAVYRPETFEHLPETVDYFTGLGIHQIYLSPDYSAPWSAADAARLESVYRAVGARYIAAYRAAKPLFVSLIDSKIAVLLRGGYQPGERCGMGYRDLAFTPDGTIYPCERLVGDGDGRLAIGHVDTGVHPERMRCHQAEGGDLAPTCAECGLRDYCMNWCGCSNYFGTGLYNRASPFLCASERAAVRVAWEVFETLEREVGDLFYDHLGGIPLRNSVPPRMQAASRGEESSPP